MEIQYKRSYAPARGRRYTAGEIPAMLGYAVEIADPRPRLREGKLEPGEMCMLLFGITPEEYNWRESAPKELDALADKLRKNPPADRLIGWRVCDLKGAPVQRKIRIETGASIDDGAFARALQARSVAAEAGPLDAELLACRRLQAAGDVKDAPEEARARLREARRALGAGLLGQERLYVADDALLNGRWPCVGLDGRLELFTRRERGERALKHIAQANGGVAFWQLREVPGAQIEDALRGWAANGLTALRVDNGFASAELEIADALEVKAAENAALRALMLREVECGVRWNRLKAANAPEPNQRGMLESMLTLRNFAWRALGQAKLWALCAGGDRRNCVLVGRRDGNERFLAAFTERARAAAFGRGVPGAPVPMEMGFDELSAHVGKAAGLLIDVAELGYRLPMDAFAKVRELRDRPPLAVRIEPPESAPQPTSDAGELPDPDRFAQADVPNAGRGSGAPKSAPRSVAGLGELPDPDQFALEAASQSSGGADAAQRAVEEADVARKAESVAGEKKGFFRRIFGK